MPPDSIVSDGDTVPSIERPRVDTEKKETRATNEAGGSLPRPEETGTFQRLLPLFLTAFSISATANSGYAILAAMKIDLVEKRHWLTEEQMADVAALAQSSPGPIGVNAAMIIGFQSAGILGGIASVLGVVTPALGIMILVSYTYQMIISNPWLAIFMQGMQIAVVALLIDVILSLFKNVTKDGVVYPLILGILSFLYVRFSGMTVAYLAIACAIAGVVKSLLIKDAIDTAADAEGGEQ